LFHSRILSHASIITRAGGVSLPVFGCGVGSRRVGSVGGEFVAGGVTGYVGGEEPGDGDAGKASVVGAGGGE